MAKRTKVRRFDERWVICAATRAAYEHAKTNKVRFKELSQLGPGLLSRVRGHGRLGSRESTVLIQFDNIKKFADLCEVPLDTLLAGGDGMNRVDATELMSSVTESLRESDQDKSELKQLIHALEHHHTNPEGIYWIGQTLVQCRSFLRRNGIGGAALSIVESLMDDIDEDTRSKEGVFDVFISPKKVSRLVDELMALQVAPR